MYLWLGFDRLENAATEQATAVIEGTDLTDGYRALIERVEAMPRNRSGADKSGAWLGSYADAKALLSLVKPAR